MTSGSYSSKAVFRLACRLCFRRGILDRSGGNRSPAAKRTRGAAYRSEETAKDSNSPVSSHAPLSCSGLILPAADGCLVTVLCFPSYVGKEAKSKLDRASRRPCLRALEPLARCRGFPSLRLPVHKSRARTCPFKPGGGYLQDHPPPFCAKQIVQLPGAFTQRMAPLLPPSLPHCKPIQEVRGEKQNPWHRGSHAGLRCLPKGRLPWETGSETCPTNNGAANYLIMPFLGGRGGGELMYSLLRFW